MITLYLIDEISIIRKVFDANGVATETTETGIKAKVEDFNGMVRDSTGQEVQGSMLIITKPDEDIVNGDMILIKKKNGITYHLSNKKFAIKKMENVAGWFASHKEIYI